MKSQKLLIEGMTCGHCVMAVKKHLGKIPGIMIEDVQIGSAKVTIDEQHIARSMLESVIEEAGYKLVSVNESE